MNKFYIEYDTEKLKDPCLLVDLDDKALIEKIFSSLKNTLIFLGGGAGLAAPQIGIHKAAFIWSKDRKVENIQLALNPLLIPDTGSGMIQSLEGCFSVPNKFFYIDRYKKISFNYFDISGKKISMVAEGLEAIILQHEYDHLNKNLIIDKGTLFKSFESPEEYEEFLKVYRNTSHYE